MKRLLFIVSCLLLFHFKFRLVQKNANLNLAKRRNREGPEKIGGTKTIFVHPAKISLRGPGHWSKYIGVTIHTNLRSVTTIQSFRQT